MPGVPWAKRLFVGSTEEITPSEAGLYDSAEISNPENSMMLMCTFTRSPGTTVEDVAVTTHHFTNYTGGAVDPSWTTTDFSTVEGYMNTFWTAMLAYMTTQITLHQYRWYEKSSSTVVPGVENPPQRVTSRGVAGGGSAAPLPPQCAMSVTEKVSARKSWGRFYIPGFTTGALASTGGRFSTTFVDTVAAAANTLYSDCATAELVPIVWSQKHKHGYAVERVQVDNTVDIIRRRRWDAPSYRKSYPV